MISSEMQSTGQTNNKRARQNKSCKKAAIAEIKELNSEVSGSPNRLTKSWIWTKTEIPKYRNFETENISETEAETEIAFQ